MPTGRYWENIDVEFDEHVKVVATRDHVNAGYSTALHGVGVMFPQGVAGGHVVFIAPALGDACGSCRSGVSWRVLLSYGVEAVGIGLIVFDLMNTVVSPTPDAGILGAALIASARTARTIRWSSKAVRDAAKALENGATEVRVASRSEAEELFLGRYQGAGYRNTTGMSPREAKDFFGGKYGTSIGTPALASFPMEVLTCKYILMKGR